MVLHDLSASKSIGRIFLGDLAMNHPPVLQQTNQNLNVEFAFAFARIVQESAINRDHCAATVVGENSMGKAHTQFHISAGMKNLCKAKGATG